ncbi:hypothetical protein [Cerasibacillus sp.]|uniref:hypothetical protein n=1 Tax=Cerasibacillus sp. TaxID=2498711 RepID=UPI002F411077
MWLSCPNCSSRDIGKVGNDQYYCWNCYIEMTVVGNRLNVHEIEADGSLISLDDLFTEEERNIH